MGVAGCGSSGKTLLSPKDPTLLSIWHVYGEQADSPMNRLITEFNDTVGREKGILLNVTNMTNSAAIGGQLQDAKAGKPGALDYPLRLVELNALEQGSGELYQGSWYDLTNETFRASWMEFAADTGYMPVSTAAFDAIADSPFEQQSYQRLYDVYNQMRTQDTPPLRAGHRGVPRQGPVRQPAPAPAGVPPAALPA